MTTTPPAESPAPLPDVRMDGIAREQGRVYQAARDQTINQITQQGPRRSLPPASTVHVPIGLSGLPRRPVAAFIGRDAALTALRTRLRNTKGTGVISQAVLGLGGVGKSELALQYAYRHRDDHRLAWWIEADSPTQIRTGLASLARALVAGVDSVAAEQATTDEAAAWALAWLRSHTGWLLVFDNVEQADDIQSYLPSLASGHVLITTRRDIGWQHLGITPLRLDLLDRPASVALLAGMLSGITSAGQDRLLDELAEQLGDLPLALTQAGAYIARTPRMTVRRYLRLLTEVPSRMLAAVPAGDNATRVVAKVWTVSHQRIGAIDPLAARLLNLLACYAPDNLPCSVLDSLDDDDLAVGEALAFLASYSLINLTTVPGDDPLGELVDLISVHRLIQATTLALLTSDQREAVRSQAALLLQAALPGHPEHVSNWPVYRRLLPHARAVLLAASGLEQICNYLRASGDYLTARVIQRQIYAHHLGASGSEHPTTLIAWHDLAYFTGLAGDAAAARDQFTALLPVRQRVQGAQHSHSLETSHQLAIFTGLAGDAAAARDQLAALLPLRERVQGAEHPDTLRTRHNLAHFTGLAGDAAAARDQFTVLLPICERVQGPEHPETLTTRHNLARWTGEAGDAAAARDQFTVLLPLRERVQGAEHPDTLRTRHSLARWTEEAKRTESSGG